MRPAILPKPGYVFRWSLLLMLLAPWSLIAAVAVMLAGCSSTPPSAPPSSTATPSTIQVAAPIQDAANQVQTFTLADLAAAEADAKAHGDYSADCWHQLAAWLPTVAPAGGSLHLGAASAWQTARDLRRQATAGIPEAVHQACAPVVLDAEQTAIKLGIAGSLAAGGIPLPVMPIPIAPPQLSAQ